MSMRADYSTIQVCQWLKYYNVNFIRIDKEDEYKIKEVSFGSSIDFVIYKDNIKISISNIKAVWYRRGRLSISYPLKLSNTAIRNSIVEHLLDESMIYCS